VVDEKTGKHSLRGPVNKMVGQQGESITKKNDDHGGGDQGSEVKEEKRGIPQKKKKKKSPREGSLG